MHAAAIAATGHHAQLLTGQVEQTAAACHRLTVASLPHTHHQLFLASTSAASGSDNRLTTGWWRGRGPRRQRRWTATTDESRRQWTGMLRVGQLLLHLLLKLLDLVLQLLLLLHYLLDALLQLLVLLF